MKPGNKVACLCLAFFLILAAPEARADRNAQPAGSRADRVTELVVEALELRGEQLENFIRVIRAYQEEARKTLHENASDPEKAREKLTALTERMIAEIRAVLTAEQWEQYRKIREQVREDFSGRRARPPAGE